jgi:hypothetical protein
VTFTIEVPKSPSGLDEVERAISTLDGRHPEHERVRRETMAAADERKRAMEKEQSRAARRRWLRVGLAVVIVAGVVVIGMSAWKALGRERTVRAELDRAEAPFVAQGMTEAASNALLARDALDVPAPAGSCYVGVATEGTVRVHAGAMAMEAAGSVGWCACVDGTVRVEGSGGLALLRVDARAVGGPFARPWTKLAPAAWGDTGQACAEATLDAWIAGAGGRDAMPNGGAWLDGPGRASLKQAGLHVVASVRPDRPFVVVESAAGDCLLATGGAEDALSVRVTGGVKRVALARGGGALAWCTSAGETTTVWRDGSSAVTVLAVPAARIGGILGMVECAGTAGVTVAPEATWLSAKDLAWDAASLLGASDVTSGTLQTVTTDEVGEEPHGAGARVTAVARTPGTPVAAMPEGVVVACDPPLDTPGTRTSLCASDVPARWVRRGEGAAAVALTPLPFWLTLLDARHEPDAVARVPEMLALARELRRMGFEPTVLEGVTELPSGVRVAGRAREDAIVAVGLVPRPPWAIPYSDGVPWDLGDRPRVVALEPGATVTLHANPPPPGALAQRRTVVFRHANRP